MMVSQPIALATAELSSSLELPVALIAASIFCSGNRRMPEGARFACNAFLIDTALSVSPPFAVIGNTARQDRGLAFNSSEDSKTTTP